MEKLSVFVTTFNNEETLGACLEAVQWADEIVVLDSFSSDGTEQIAGQHRAVFYQHAFLGYGPQKQLAMEKTTHRWVLLLDADEVLSPALQTEIQQLLAQGPELDGYEIPRQEQLFWRMCNPSVRMNGFLRLFDKTRAHISDMPVHAAPKVVGRIGRLKAPFYHFGEVNVHVKVDKVNAYSSGLVYDKVARGKVGSPWLMVFYPPLVFVKLYLFKRNFMSGWPGFMGSVIGAFYAFLKYAKLYEYRMQQRHGTGLLPKGAPTLKQPKAPK